MKLLGELTELVERKARDFFGELTAREWLPIPWDDLSDAEQRAIDMLCLCGVAQQRVTQGLNVDGEKRVATIVCSGDCSERLAERFREELISRFGVGHRITLQDDSTIDGLRLSARGQDICENGSDEDLMRALIGPYPAVGNPQE